MARALDRGLLGKHHLQRAWFDIMNRLNAAPGRRLRMQELAQASALHE